MRKSPRLNCYENTSEKTPEGGAYVIVPSGFTVELFMKSTPACVSAVNFNREAAVRVAAWFYVGLLRAAVRISVCFHSRI